MTAKKRWINEKFDKNDRLSQQDISWSSSDEESPPNKRPKKVSLHVTSEETSQRIRREEICAQSTLDMFTGETYIPLMNVSPLSQPSSCTDTGSSSSLSPVLVKKRDTRQENGPGTSEVLLEHSPLLTKHKTADKWFKSALNITNCCETQLGKSSVAVKVPLLADSPVLRRDKTLEKYSKNAFPISRQKNASKQSNSAEVQPPNSPVVKEPSIYQLINDETPKESQLLSSLQDICSGDQLYYSPSPKSPLLCSTKPEKKFKRNPSSDISELHQSQHISVEDSICNLIFDENSPTKPPSTKASAIFYSDSSQLIDSLSTQTNKGQNNCVTSSDDRLSIMSSSSYDPPSIRRKKYKKNGLMKLLQKILTKQKTSLGIWRHEITLEGVEAVKPNEDVIEFKVQLIKREYGNTLLECNSGTLGLILVAVSAIVTMDFVVDGKYLLFPPYECRNVSYKSQETVCYFNSTRILRK